MQPRWDSIVQALSAAPQRVHGDVHGGNILTHGRKATGIIDCDHLPLAPRGYDLGYYMAFGVQWRLAASQPSPPADEALPVIARHLLHPGARPGRGELAAYRVLDRRQLRRAQALIARLGGATMEP
jgi:aminoglycoside phosphotransferase (APT) family kinase protein